MENSVNLHLDEYNRLRDFEIKMNNNSCLIWSDFENFTVFTEIDAIKKVCEINKNIKDKLNACEKNRGEILRELGDYKYKNNQLKQEVDGVKAAFSKFVNKYENCESNINDKIDEITKDVKKMSIWEFIKWRKS